jgi:hypothetical protein
VSLSPSKKATKKIRLGEGAAIGISVGFEGLGAPERGIVTRASRLSELNAAPLFELAEDGAAEAVSKSTGSSSNADTDISEVSASDAVAAEWEDIDLNLGEEELEEAITTGEEVLEILEQQESAELDNEEPGSADLEPDVDQTHLDDEEYDGANRLQRMATRSAGGEDCRADSPDHEANFSTIETDERATPGATDASEDEKKTQRKLDARAPADDDQNDAEAEPATLSEEIPAEIPVFSFAPAAQIPVLPAGFVSPAKDRRRRPIREPRQSMASRRRTLPVNFTAFESSPVIAISSVESQTVEEEDLQVEEQDDSRDAPSDTAIVDTEMEVVVEELDGHDSDEWEDLPDVVEENISNDGQSGENMIDTAPAAIVSETVEEAETQATQTLLNNEHTLLLHPNENFETDIEQSSEARAAGALGDEATPDIENEQSMDPETINEDAMALDVSQDGLDTSEHEVNNEQSIPPQIANATQDKSVRLSARQASRRQSSSPRKARTTNASHRNLPHLVAFTPMKIRGPSTSHESVVLQPETELTAIQSVEPEDEPPISPRCNSTLDPSTTESMAVDEETDSSSTTRSVSAPPEPSQTSPRKSRQPRISDDTALLQAFLSRAAESKSKAERRMSASKRESLENRRDSDTIRFALASSPGVPQCQEKQAEPEVLKNLDPNSPSPRKQQIIVDKAIKAEQPEAISQPSPAIEEAQSVTSVDAAPETRNKRRSTRPRKQPQVLDTTERGASSEANGTNAGPNKISIRPFGADPVVWKRPEAQEIALLTRTNTRKNKGALNPQQRLTKLAAEEAGLVQIEGTDIVMPEADLPKIKAKTVRWAETLAMFQAGPVVVEDAVAADAQEPAPVVNLLDAAALDEVVNKPQIKKLKPRLTPRAPINIESIDELEADSDVVKGPPTFQLPDLPPATATAEREATKLKRRTRLATPAKIKVAKTSTASASDDHVDIPDVQAQPAAKLGEHKSIPVPATKRPMMSKLPAPVSSSSSTASTLAHPAKDRETNSLIASPPKKKLRGMRSSTRQQQQQVPSLDLTSTASTSTGLKPPSSLSFGFAGSSVPKLEAKPTSLAVPSSDLTLSLVSSPAKKAPRLFPMAMSGTYTSSHREMDVVKGMGSPAKKRGRPPKA